MEGLCSWALQHTLDGGTHGAFLSPESPCFLLPLDSPSVSLIPGDVCASTLGPWDLRVGRGALDIYDSVAVLEYFGKSMINIPTL